MRFIDMWKRMNSTRNAPVMLITNFLPSEDLVKKQLIVMIFVFVLVYVFAVNCVYLLTDSDSFRSRRVGRPVYDAKITIVCRITIKTLRDFLKNSMIL